MLLISDDVQYLKLIIVCTVLLLIIAKLLFVSKLLATLLEIIHPLGVDKE